MTKNIANESFVYDSDSLGALFNRILADGYQVYGPKLKQGSIVLGRLHSFAELPAGYRDIQAPGSYALDKTGDATLFGYSVGPQSIKNVLHPPRRKLWDALRGVGASLKITASEPEASKIALFGIRSCDVEAIRILDKVFLGSGFTDSHYKEKRDQLLLVTATCRNPSSLCFCTSMGHGPKAKKYDINITEIKNDTEHYFVLDAGSAEGSTLLEPVEARAATAKEESQAEEVAVNACLKIEKRLNTKNLPEILADNLNHPTWDDVAERCLSCGNCTMVCPTCFCTSTVDNNDLEGDHSERWQQWDSCFTSDFSYIHGGTVRSSTKSRYRQWLTHKLGTWQSQFGTSGCVGCGRCIAWCPVGIDIVETVQGLLQSQPSGNNSKLPGTRETAK